MTRSQAFFFLSLIAAFMSFSDGLPQSAVAQSQDKQNELTPQQLAAVKQLEQKRIAAIDQVIGSVVAIYDDDRKGGGSGVIIDSSGIALTNHHVIMGSGVEGWGGLADGKLYRWELIGTDPGGDVAIIQMKGDQEFPFTPLGDSDEVRVGDWALAMGNPFILTEDQSPTVTLGIVSGVKRYQPGAGNNQLVYGNCIQVDSSINPGNSGGPLFNLEGQVIGINGRGSFKDRGRVNVGLGYAISANQIKNFIPDLLATKLTEHATLDIQFEDRDGKVLCSRRDALAPIAEAGLELGDELIEFEGVSIKTANQFTNLICTLPELWPIELKVRKPDGSEKTFQTRAIGLPYKKPPKPRPQPNPTPEERRKIRRQLEMLKMLTAEPGAVRVPETNRKYAEQVVAQAGRALIGRRGALKENQNRKIARRLRIKGTLSTQTQQDDFELICYGASAQSFYWKVAGENKYEVLYTGEGSQARDEKIEPIAFADLLDRPQNLFAVGLAAIVAELSGDRNATKGAVVFDKWEEIDGHWLPVQSRVVSGLAETKVMSIQINSVVEETDDDAKLLVLPRSSRESKTAVEENAEAKE